MTTGQRIKAARKKVGVTQEDLGKKLGVSPSFVAQYETGKRNPKIETLKRIADALSISIYELIDGDDLKRAVIYGEGLGGNPAEQDDTSSELTTIVDSYDSHSHGWLSEDAPDTHTHSWLSGKGIESEDFGLVDDELEDLFSELQDGKPLFLSPDELAKLKGTPKEQIAAALEKQEREKEKRDATIAALRTQMEKMRQRYGPTAFPEFDELERLLYKFQRDAITQGEQEQIKALLKTVQNRLNEYNAMAPSPYLLSTPSTPDRQDEELRKEWNKLSLSDVFILPGNHDIVPASEEQIAAALEKNDLHGVAKLVKGLAMDDKQVQGLDLGDGETIFWDSRMGCGKSTMIHKLVKIIKDPHHRIAAALDKLNDEGREKVATYAEDLVEMPKYQAQEPPTAPARDTPPAPEGTDTTPAEMPPGGPQKPPESYITAITMICPICGMTLRGDPATGKAHCPYCHRSFTLPKKARAPKK